MYDPSTASPSAPPIWRKNWVAEVAAPSSWAGTAFWTEGYVRHRFDKGGVGGHPGREYEPDQEYREPDQALNAIVPAEARERLPG